MEGNLATVAEGNGKTDDAKATRLKQRLEELLRQAAQVEVELSRADGSIRGIPHDSVIEGRAHQLGKQLSRQIQQQQMNELAAVQAETSKCPACNTRCRLQFWRQRAQTRFDVSQVFSKRELGERQARKLVATREAALPTMISVLADASVELAPWRKFHELCKHELSVEHKTLLGKKGPASQGSNLLASSSRVHASVDGSIVILVA